MSTPQGKLDDLECYRLEPQVTPPNRQPLVRKGQPFVKGPIPLAWLTRAAALPGKALAVGIAIWHRVGLKRTRMVRLSLSSVEKLFGVQRDAARRGLAALEKAGLVSVQRRPGCAPQVTVSDQEPTVG